MFSDGLEVPPVASQLMQSLRSIGYTTQAAVADVIDNSLGAGATRIDIDFAHTPRAFVSIIDNGAGMSRDELLQAMRYGSRDPREVRLGDDLGRFGLGLKTASLSQCVQRLPTKAAAGISGAQSDGCVAEDARRSCKAYLISSPLPLSLSSITCVTRGEPSEA